MGFFDKIYVREKSTGNLVDVTNLNIKRYESFLDMTKRLAISYKDKLVEALNSDDALFFKATVTNKTVTAGEKYKVIIKGENDVVIINSIGRKELCSRHWFI